MVCAFSQPSIDGFSNFQNMVKGLGKLFKKHLNNFPASSTVWRIFAENKKKVEKTANFQGQFANKPDYRFFLKRAQIDRQDLNFQAAFMQKVPPKPPSR